MYLRKQTAPRVITLPDGTTMTRADLPPVDTKRWVVSRKVAVVKAVLCGLVTKEEVMDMYMISEDEFDSWMRAVDRHGMVALKATLTQKYRENPIENSCK